jgi:hypothetical protein
MERRLNGIGRIHLSTGLHPVAAVYEGKNELQWGGYSPPCITARRGILLDSNSFTTSMSADSPQVARKRF